MGKKILGLAIVGLFLAAGNVFAMSVGADGGFWGEGFSGSDYYFYPGQAVNDQPPQFPIIEPLFEGPFLFNDLKSKKGEINFDNLEMKEVTPDGAFLKNGGKFAPDQVLFDSGITVDNAAAIDYMNNLMANLPTDQQALLKGVIDLIKADPDVKVSIDLFQTGENTLGVGFDVYKETEVDGKLIRERLADARINLNAADAATIEGIRQDFEAIQQEEDPAAQKELLDKLLNSDPEKGKLSKLIKEDKLTVEGSDLSLEVKDPAKIKEIVDAASDYLAQNGLGEEARKLSDEINKILAADPKAGTLREEYRNGKLVSTVLDVRDEAGKIAYSAVLRYKDGEVASAGINKYDIENNISESVSVGTQERVPEGKTADEAARDFFARYGVQDPVTQFGQETWNKLLEHWGDWTVSNYDQSSFDQETGITSGTAKLIFIYGENRIELPEINYTRKPESLGSGS